MKAPMHGGMERSMAFPREVVMRGPMPVRMHVHSITNTGRDKARNHA
jgi:hypothetical protein